MAAIHFAVDIWDKKPQVKNYAVTGKYQ